MTKLLLSHTVYSFSFTPIYFCAIPPLSRNVHATNRELPCLNFALPLPPPHILYVPPQSCGYFRRSTLTKNNASPSRSRPAIENNTALFRDTKRNPYRSPPTRSTPDAAPDLPSRTTASKLRADFVYSYIPDTSDRSHVWPETSLQRSRFA